MKAKPIIANPAINEPIHIPILLFFIPALANITVGITAPHPAAVNSIPVPEELTLIKILHNRQTRLVWLQKLLSVHLLLQEL